MAQPAEITQLRRMVDEPTTENYTDLALSSIIDQEGTLDASAAVIWQEKAARYHTLAQTSESGSSRSLQNIHSNALAMAKFYGGKTIVEEPPELSKTTVAIERL